MPGVSVGKSEEMMGRDCSSLDEVIFENVRVLKDNLLIPDGTKGFKEMMAECNGKRCANSPFCIGFAQGADEKNVRYCKQRIQFGNPILKIQGVRWILADIATQIQAARLLLYEAVTKAERRGKVIAKEAAFEKKSCERYVCLGV